MSYSLNEVQAMAKGAVRGAGYDWGLAESTGRAIRWLCRYGVNGVHALATLLEQNLSGCSLPFAPQDFKDDQKTPAQICPLQAGTAFSDFSAQKGPEVAMKNVCVPVLMLPFIARVAHRQGLCLVTSCDGIHASTNGASLWLTQDLPNTAQRFSVCIGDPVGHPSATCHRSFARVEDWERLNSFSLRTCAPASEESRLRGAGAGVLDDD